VKSAILNWKYM